MSIHRYKLVNEPTGMESPEINFNKDTMEDERFFIDPESECRWLDLGPAPHNSMCAYEHMLIHFRPSMNTKHFSAQKTFRPFTEWSTEMQMFCYPMFNQNETDAAYEAGMAYGTAIAMALWMANVPPWYAAYIFSQTLLSFCSYEIPIEELMEEEETDDETKNYH